ncbi:blastopia polyprotein [Lasius niger]|uniref:RNA-directed DNA polymerase n=1 Tax=Lasius niger TaxID=67767 RepID=A0A0J7KQN5_LASNI|nr:blastopia polyprotein [Lasius niger]
MRVSMDMEQCSYRNSLPMARCIQSITPAERQHLPKLIRDCSAFQQTMDKRDIVPRIARWALMLAEFDYTIRHRSGARMKHVDALSRFPVLYAVATELTVRIRKAQQEDDGTRAIIEILKEKPYEDYTLIDGVLFKFSDGRDLLVVPKKLQTEIIKDVHEKGHFSTRRTEEAIKQEYYIPNLSTKVAHVIDNCIKCIIVNRKAGKKEGFLHPLFKESLPLHTLHIDHIGPLESTRKAYQHILVVVDSFTKFVWLYPVKSITSIEVISKLEIQKTTFGNPFQIITDRGTAFTSQQFKDYCISENIELKFITAGLPRANGQVERINATVVNVLAKLSAEDPTKWYQHVAAVQLAINSTYQRSINRTPFELLTGVKMLKDDHQLAELLNDEAVERLETKRANERAEAREQILEIQKENRKQFNKRRRPASQYQVGDLVAVKRTQLGPGLKLKPKYLGPYRIGKIKGNDTYDVVREGAHDGPKRTTTCAEYIKRWRNSESSSESDDAQEGRMWEVDSDAAGPPEGARSEEKKEACGTGWGDRLRARNKTRREI